MNIALLTASYFPEYNGAALRVHGLVEGLTPYGHKIVVLVPGTIFSREQHKHCIVYRIPVRKGLPSNIIERFTKFHWRRYRSFLRYIDSIVVREKIDIIHTRQPFDLFYVGFHIQRRFHLPWIAEAHKLLSITDFEEKRIFSFLKNMLLHEELRLMNKSDLVVTMTPSGEGTLREFGVTKPIVVVPNASSLPLTRNTKDRHAKKFSPYLLYVGNIRTVEGLERLVFAFKRILEHLPNLQLVIIGGGDRRSLEQLVRRYNLHGHIHLLGELPFNDLLPYYRHATLFVQPRKSVRYHRDIIGLKMYDALRAGLPIATSDYGELATLVRNKGIGVLSHVDDTENFADTVVALLKDKKRYATIRKRVLVHRKDFSWRASCRALDRAIRTLC